MAIIIFVDVLSLVFVALGYLLAFHHKTIRARWKTLKSASPVALLVDQPAEQPNSELESVLRMAGVMLMAFSFAIGAFTTLIFMFTTGSHPAS